MANGPCPPVGSVTIKLFITSPSPEAHSAFNFAPWDLSGFVSDNSLGDSWMTLWEAELEWGWGAPSSHGDASRGGAEPELGQAEL